ncbi:MAG TPA: hypothetical protein VJH75_01225 [Patescibacteria group bacterium]|nr:hypothetical protein [Patescibacteria group bacterium]
MEFLKFIFTLILFLNIPLALASFFFAYILLRRAKGDAIYFNFGMAVLFLGLWIAGTSLTFIPFIPLSTVDFEIISLIFSLWVVHYFLLFTYRFPFQLKINKGRDTIFYFCSSLLTLSLFIPNLYVIAAEIDFPFLREKVNYFGFTVFILYVFFLILFSFRNLIKKYKISDGVHRIYLKKIIIGTFFSIIISIFFGFMVPYFANLDFSYIGTLSTFAVLAYIYSILFSKKIV